MIRVIAARYHDLARLAEIVTGIRQFAVVVDGGLVVATAGAGAAQRALVTVAVILEKTVVALTSVVGAPRLGHDCTLEAAIVLRVASVLKRAVRRAAVVPQLEITVKTIFASVHAARGGVRQTVAVVVIRDLGQLGTSRIHYACT